MSKELFKEVNLKLVKLYGNSFGHFTKTVEAGLILWLDQQRDLSNNNHSFIERTEFNTFKEEIKEMIKSCKK